MGKSNGLRALDAAQLLATEAIAATSDFPSPEPAGLRRQLSEAANSIPANIAEGLGRGTSAERLNRLRLARGSLEEAQSHLKVSWRAGYLKTATFYRLWNLSVVLGRMIAGLIARG